MKVEDIFTHSAHQWREKSSAKWKGGCPWHESESGTAFYVETAPPFLWNCPGCGNLGGDAVSYLWKLQNGSHAQNPTGRDFIDVARRLCEMADVPFPEGEASPEAAERLRTLQAREAILADAYAICREWLEGPEGEQAREYLRSRGINDHWQAELQLGLYRSQHELRKQLLARGHRFDDIRASGVITEKLVGYITFPWWDESGHPLTLYGRWPGKPPDGKGKQNTLPNPRNKDGEELDRSKRSPLYLDRALYAGHDRLILVEGLLDGAVLHAHGDARAIACVGAHLSEDQLQTLVRRRVKEVTICLDPDRVGDDNIRSNACRLRVKGITPYVAPRLPDGVDPDEYVLKHGIEEWKRGITRRVHGYRHIARHIIAEQGEREPGDDGWEDRVIEKALAFAGELPADHNDELTRHFWTEITAATGSRPDDLQARLAGQRQPHGTGQGNGTTPAATSPAEHRFAWRPIDSKTFFTADYRPSWLVQHLIVCGQPALVGGPKKNLKTGVLTDLGVSLASCTPFLGVFHVPAAKRVAILSGESGRFTLQETGRRIAAARGLDPEALADNLVWMFELPQLGMALDMKALREGLIRDHIDVLILDPLYLSLLAGLAPGTVRAENLFDMGPLLLAVTKTCLDCNTTPIFAHHARKGVGKGTDPIDLDDLAFAGLAEFARQWLLLSRREPYEPGSGLHQLWLSAGGSVGHSGLWAVDVDEAVLQEDFSGRKWEVTVTSGTDARSNKKDEKEEERAEKKRRQEHEDQMALLAALDNLDPSQGGMGYRRVQALAGLSNDRMSRACERLITDRVIARTPVTIGIGNKAKRTANGIRRLQDAGDMPTWGAV